MSKEAVNHPDHCSCGGMEVIDIIDAFNLNFDLGNAVKYILRAGRKDPEMYLQDLNKAIWYLKREIDINTKEEN